MEFVIEYDWKIYVCIIFIYSFLGWCLESFGCILNPKIKKFVNRGFLIGPYCPVYGIGVFLITFLLSKYSNDVIALFVLSIFVCGLLEYTTSFIMEKIFSARWWDYSSKKYNINGRVCLEMLIPFGIAGTISQCVINPIIINLLNKIDSNILTIIVITLLVLIAIDILISFTVIRGFKSLTKNKNGEKGLEVKDNTEEIVEHVKNKTEEISEEIKEKVELKAMETVSNVLYYKRKIKIKTVRKIRSKYYFKLKKLKEELKYQSKLLEYKAEERKEYINKKVKDELEKIEKVAKEKISTVKENRKAEIKRIYEKKSILHKRIVDAFPNIEIIERIKKDKKEK